MSDRDKSILDLMDADICTQKEERLAVMLRFQRRQGRAEPDIK